MVGFEEWFLISESKQQIVNLGYPVEIASIFKNKFGRNAYLLGKWFKKYVMMGREESANWWDKYIGNSSSIRSRITINNMLNVIRASNDKDSVMEALKKNGFYVEAPDSYDEYRLMEIKKGFMEAVEEELMKNVFFRSYPFIKGIINGTINADKYRNISFDDANKNYEEDKLFLSGKPLKEYPDGMKWIEAGKYCALLGNKMANCGSIGVMSTDVDRKIIALFDMHNNPHVMVTYSPNHNRISGEQGKGSTKIKEKYDYYVLDLAKSLGATYDWLSDGGHPRTKLKYFLGNDANTMEQIGGTDADPYYSFIKDGKKYYTDCRAIMTQEQLDKAKDLINSGELPEFKMYLGSDTGLATALLMNRRSIRNDVLGPFVAPMKLASPEMLKITRD